MHLLLRRTSASITPSGTTIFHLHRPRHLTRNTPSHKRIPYPSPSPSQHFSPRYYSTTTPSQSPSPPSPPLQEPSSKTGRTSSSRIMAASHDGWEAHFPNPNEPTSVTQGYLEQIFNLDRLDPESVSRPIVPDPDYPFNANINNRIFLCRGDIARMRGVDAIVNAANRTLLGGAGVDGAIHRAAGTTLVRESRLLAPCEIGEAKLTGGHNIPVRGIIHTNGPRGDHPGGVRERNALLRQCYKSCLDIAVQQNYRSIAFPCISTGIFGFPGNRAAEIAVRTCRRYLEFKNKASRLERVIFVLFLEKDWDAYERAVLMFLPEQAQPGAEGYQRNNAFDSDEDEPEDDDEPQPPAPPTTTREYSMGG